MRYVPIPALRGNDFVRYLGVEYCLSVAVSRDAHNSFESRRYCAGAVGRRASGHKGSVHGVLLCMQSLETIKRAPPALI